jgi:hypothetical protein
MKQLYLPKEVGSFYYISYADGNPGIEVVVGSPAVTRHAGDQQWLNALLQQYSNLAEGVAMWDAEGRISELGLSYAGLTTLDVSGLTNLTVLYCYGNNLSVLDVSKNTALTELYCSDNNLSVLDVSKNTALTSLDCQSNNLSELNVSKNTALTYLDCWDNNLSILDVSKNAALTQLYCGDNNLSTLDVSKNTALESLGCDGNNLSVLDVSKNTALTGLYCTGNSQLTVVYVPLGFLNGGRQYDIDPGVELIEGSPTTAVTKPSAPKNFLATPSADSVSLKWDAVDGATSYKLQFKTGTGEFMDIPAEQVTMTGTTATITGLAAGTTYYFRAAATNEGGESAFVLTNATTTVSSGIQPPNNAQVDVTEGKETKSATVTWTAAAGAAYNTVYLVQYREIGGNGKWKSVTVKASNKNGLTKDLKLKAGKEYEFTVSVKGAKGQAGSIVIEAGKVRVWDVVPAASLATLKAAELPEGFVSQSQIALRVKNLNGSNVIGTAKKNVEVDTLTVTYTFGKTKYEKEANLKTVTLTYNKDTKEWIADNEAVTFEKRIIIVKGLEDTKKYTVTAQFSNLTEGKEATSAKATSKTVSTTKLNWQAVTGISTFVDISAQSESESVTWEAVNEYGDVAPARPATYTVKIWYGNKVVKKLKATSTSLTLKASQLKSLAKLDGQVLYVTVIANADKTHVAGNEADATHAAVNWA